MLCLPFWTLHLEAPGKLPLENLWLAGRGPDPADHRGLSEGRGGAGGAVHQRGLDWIAWVRSGGTELGLDV